MRRFNKCLIHKEEYGLNTKDAIKEQNKKLQKKKVEKYLSKCLERMFGQINPYKRNEDYPFVWHN